jgi:ribosomal protein S17
MFGKKILTKREQKHLKNSGIKTLYDFKKTRTHQKEFERLDGGKIACFECRQIARKLKME